MPILEEIIQGQLASFGQSLRSLRLGRGWTLDHLARQSGLSKGYLSRLESGERQVSIAVALTLAGIFQVSVAALFEAHAPEPCVIVRAGEVAPQIANGLTCWPLSRALPAFRIQPLRVRVPLHREGDQHQRHGGEEWLYVVSGRLTLSLDGASHELSEGDAAHFDARLPHRLIARGRVEPEILLVAVPAASANPLLSLS